MGRAGGYPAYTLIKVEQPGKNEVHYVSKKKHKSHAEATQWVKDCQAHYKFQGAWMRNRPMTWTDQPDDAIVYPR